MPGSGTTVSGNLVADHGEALVLRNCTVYWEQIGGAEKPIMGEVRVLKANVDFYTLT